MIVIFSLLTAAVSFVCVLCFTPDASMKALALSYRAERSISSKKDCLRAWWKRTVLATLGYRLLMALLQQL